MAEYIEQGYTEPNYTEGDEISPTVATCDLSSLEAEFVELDLSIASLDDKVDYLISAVTSITNILNSVNSKTTDLNIDIDIVQSEVGNLVNQVATLSTKTDIQNLNTSIEHIILPSLNGNGSEYKDGIEVKVSGREAVYTVERSYHSLYSDNGYTVHYDLVSSDGYRVTVPEALLTKYIPTVV